jgi:hypothetical protein
MNLYVTLANAYLESLYDLCTNINEICIQVIFILGIITDYVEYELCYAFEVQVQ